MIMGGAVRLPLCQYVGRSSKVCQTDHASGRNYLAELSRIGKLPARVISMGAEDGIEHLEKSRRAGCAGHLAKLVRMDALTGLLAAS